MDIFSIGIAIVTSRCWSWCTLCVIRKKETTYCHFVHYSFISNIINTLKDLLLRSKFQFYFAKIVFSFSFFFLKFYEFCLIFLEMLLLKTKSGDNLSSFFESRKNVQWKWSCGKKISLIQQCWWLICYAYKVVFTCNTFE